MIKKLISSTIATIIAISGTFGTAIVAQAANYSAFPVYQECKEDTLQFAPSIGLNGSYTVEYRNGTYTEPTHTKLYSVSETKKALKFVPNETGYYETSICVNERNRHMTAQFAYTDDASLQKNQYYSVSKGSYEYNIHTSREESTSNSTRNEYKNTARGAAYLEKGKTYYIIGYCTYDDYNVERLLKTDVQGYTYHTVPATIKVYKHNHNYEVTTYNYSDYTSARYNCNLCNYSTHSEFYNPKTISLSATNYKYNGKTKTPSVVVKDSNGKKISSAYYDVSYSGGRKNVGKYTVKVKFKKEYARFGSLSKTFTISPKGTNITKITASKKGFKVNWKKQTAQVSGYQIQYSTNKNFKNAKTVTVGGSKTTSKKVSKLKAKKKYYVRVRTYKTVSKVKYYSSWSGNKSVKSK